MVDPAETVQKWKITISKAPPNHFSYVMQVLTFVLLIMLSFSGFLVTDIPVYFKWIGKISYLTYVGVTCTLPHVAWHTLTSHS